ncbi:MAG: Sua5/YciO/YrdC/YwlC family protein [Planctomycetia bacterium]
MAKILRWNDAGDKDAAARTTAAMLADGGVVLVPTGSRYALAVDPRHAAAAARALASADGVAPALAFDGPDDLLDFAPNLGRVGRRLIERCLPGPVVFLVDAAAIRWPVDPKSAISTTAREAVVRPDAADRPWVRLTAPAHDLPGFVVRRLGGPVLLVGDWSTLDALNQEKVAADLVVDDGPPRFPAGDTEVRLDGDGYVVVAEGVVSAGRLRRSAGEVVTFVCTGNTCRSPMAEALFKRKMADRLGCDAADLPDHGVIVLSAGTSAPAGAPAAEQAAEVVRRHGASLADHATQPLSEELLRHSDRILTMTRDHLAVVRRAWPEAAPRARLLCGASDLPDPVGGPLEEYEACADMIARHLDPLVDEMAGRPSSPAAPAADDR